MNLEQRKDETIKKLTSSSQNELQKEYNYLYSEYIEYTAKVDELEVLLKESTEFYTQLIEKYKSKRDTIKDKTEDIIAEAKKQKLKIKEKSLKYY